MRLSIVRLLSKMTSSLKKAPPANVEIVVVAGGRRDTSTCVLVSTDYSNYLFNCPEGAQRILTDIGGSKFSRLEHIFMTTNRWKNGGGLLGMALTLQTAGGKRLSLHGPTNCDKILTMARTFTTDQDELKLDIEPCFSSSTAEFETMFSDDSITVGCIPLVASENGSLKKRRNSPEFGLDAALAYVITPKPKNRKVDMNKCVALGLPRGPAIGKLVQGETITLQDGRVIKPDDVLDDQLPSRPVIFVECPNNNYLDALTSNSLIKQMMQDGDDLEKIAQLVVHMSPSDVFMNEEYQQWMKSFCDKTQHLVLNENCPFVAHDRIYRIQSQLNLLDDDIFKLLDDQKEENIKISTKNPLDLSDQTIVQGGTGLSYNCRLGEFQSSVEKKSFPISLSNEEFLSEINRTDDSEFSKSLKVYKEKVGQMAKQDDLFPKILFLGTASAVPGKRRNSSAILLQLLNENGQKKYCLIDCAEGTVGQFFRYFGNEQFDQVLSELDLVLLSHRHADHHMGFLGIIYERRRAFKRLGLEYKPLTVVYPRYQIGNWLKGYSAVLDPPLMNHLIQVVETEQLTNQAPSSFTIDEPFNKLLCQIGLKQIESIPVKHCRNAFGYQVETLEGFRLVYSGDTMPCDSLVLAGRNCDVLIHEATFGDDLKEEAVSKKHSTISEAIDVGRRMMAKATILTHFSQRYETIPHLTGEMVSHFKKHNVGIAFDNMLVGPGQFKALPGMVPVLIEMFADKLGQLEEVQQKRNLRKERELAGLSSVVDSVKKGKQQKKNN